MPFLKAPHDALRDGLTTLKDGVSSSHPVESIQKAHGLDGERSRLQMLQNVYGSALPARMHIEKQILSRVERLPGLPSSRLGLESLTGELDDFSFDSYLNLPGESEVSATDLHSAMEKRLGLDTKPCNRPIV